VNGIAASKGAKEAIEKAGGSVKLPEPAPAPEKKLKAKPKQAAQA